MNLFHYEVLVKVAELKSITKVAELYNYTQPNISHIITSFENRIGFPMFVRNRDSVIPTENGKHVLKYCYKILDCEAELQDFIAGVNGLAAGALNVGSLSSMIIEIVPKVITEFHSVYPNIEIKLQELGSKMELRDAIINGNIDVGFVDEITDKNIEFLPLIKDPIVAIMHEKHPLAKYDKLDIEQMRGCSFIVCRNWHLSVHNMIINNKYFRANIKHHTDSDIAAISLVANKLGIYLLSTLQTGLLPDHVVYRPLNEDYHRILGLAIRKNKQQSRVLQAFTDTARTLIPE